MVMASVAAFSAYFSMYAFRRPFTAATFEGQVFAGGVIGLKTALILSQILGYTISKYIGVKICSEANATRRGPLLLGLIAMAWGSLLLENYRHFSQWPAVRNGLGIGGGLLRGATLLGYVDGGVVRIVHHR
jgi:hypothetical protein